MPTNREIALHQALIAVLIEAEKGGADLNSLVEKINVGLLGNAFYRIVEHPHVTNALQELEEAKGSAQAMTA